MSNLPPIEEAREDLKKTNKDIELLQAIIPNLRAFAYDTDEERAYFKRALIQFEVALEHGRRLKAHMLKLYPDLFLERDSARKGTWEA